MAEQINWGSVADWASAFGSVAASITALYLARAASTIKLQGYVGLRVVVGGGHDPVDVLLLHITNVGSRTTKVTTISIHTGLIRKKHAIIPNWDATMSTPLPLVIADSEEGSWSFLVGADFRWLKEICAGFTPSWWEVETFRFVVHTSNGGRLTLKPESEMRQKMHELRKAAAVVAP